MSRRRSQRRAGGDQSHQQSQQQGKAARNGRAKQQRSNAPAIQPAEFWRAAPAAEPVDPIEPAADPTALLRSLGTPPLTGQAAVADHYLAAVATRAAGLATALAAATGLLADDDA